MLYTFLLVLGLVGITTYLLVIFREVPGAVEERLGSIAALPEHVGQWQPDETSEQGHAALARGERREVRLWHQPSGGAFGRERLCEQVRYRDLASGTILHCEPDRPVKRQRSRST